MINLLGGRKAFMCFFIIMIAVALDSTLGLSDQLTQLLKVVVGAFVIGNLGEHGFQTLKKKKKESTQTIDLEPISVSLDGTRDQIKEEIDKLKKDLGKLKTPEVKLPDELDSQVRGLMNSSAVTNQAISKIITKIDTLAQKAGVGPL